MSISKQLIMNIEKYFYKKDLVKIIHLLDELNKDKYTKNILKHLANDNIDKWK